MGRHSNQAFPKPSGNMAMRGSIIVLGQEHSERHLIYSSQLGESIWVVLTLIDALIGQPSAAPVSREYEAI